MESSKVNSSSLVVGIDASRNRSGGAKAHLIGILVESDPTQHGIREVHVWAYRSLLESIPDAPWLVKHNPDELQGTVVKQVWWQRFRFPEEAEKAGCSIVFNTDAGTVSNFRPSVTMSQDMLSYEPGEIQRFGFGKARARLILLRYMQNRSIRECDGVIFLTKYAAKVIQRSCGLLSRIAYIPHGIGAAFRSVHMVTTWPETGERAVKCLYVSNAAMYKHQWVVVRAITVLRARGYNVTLSLIGGGSGRAQRLLDKQIAESDPNGVVVEQLDFIPQDKLPAYLARADLFVFASSCENMPITLVEAMAAGLPITCSNRGPMPEVLADGGLYFDPENADSIADAIEQIIVDREIRERIAHRAKILSEQWSWQRCADETWTFIVDTYKNINS